MQNTKSKKRILVMLLTLLVLFEGFYLYAVPKILNKVANATRIKNYVNTKTPVKIDYKNLRFKTHIVPSLTVKSDKIEVFNKETEELIGYVTDPTAGISVFPILIKRFNLEFLNASDAGININIDKNGKVDIIDIFKSDKKSGFKVLTNKIEASIYEYNISVNDGKTGKNFLITGTPFELERNKNFLRIKTQGSAKFESPALNLDIDIQTKYPVTIKDFSSASIKGRIKLSQIDLSLLHPFVKEYVNQDITKLKGYLNNFEISANESDLNNNDIGLKLQIKDFEVDKKGWENHVTGNGYHEIESELNIRDKKISAETLNYRAEGINVNAAGYIDLKSEKPELDINLKVNDTKAEKLAAVLPPNLVPKLRTIEKIKTYGVFGDISAEMNFKGKIPQPDITGTIRGENLHILDKSVHKQHKATVNLTFDKRILNMDILIDMFNNQHAKVNGYVYMFRDGVNNVTIKTSDNTDFPLAQKLVLPISKVFNFQLGPIPEMNITSGKGIIDVNVMGSIDTLAINGYCKFDKANLTYNGLYADIKNGKGRVDFKDDIITINSDRVYVKNNFINIDGKVKINDNLDFNVSTKGANSADVLEVINKSELLKDVKAGMAVITSASGAMNLFVNMKAKIVPVAFGAPPLPPEEAFTDIKVKGYADLLGNRAYLEGFRTPLEKVKGRVDFTEETVNLNTLTAISGTSPLNISGNIFIDINSKVPDVDIKVTGKSVNLKDTIKFLAESYLYPPDYPDISALYNIASKHDLFFKYKAKSIDFVPDKAYAVMNVIPDDTESPLVATKGRVILDKSVLKVENAEAKLFDSIFTVNGTVKDMDKPVQNYNLDINGDDFDIAYLNRISQIQIIPEEIKQIASKFKDFQGKAKYKIGLKNNYPAGNIKIEKFKAIYADKNLPIEADEFSIHFKDKKMHIENMTGKVGEMPFFADIKTADVYTNQKIEGYFSIKPTNDIMSLILPSESGINPQIIGDVNISGSISGGINDLNIKPKLMLNPDANIKFANADMGETGDKREFLGDINIKPDKVSVNKVDYIKYIESQNNKTNPILFATGSGILKFDENNNLIPYEIKVKTEKSLSAKLLNIFLKTPLFRQGAINADIVYEYSPETNDGRLKGEVNCKNLDIPLFDAVIKNIELKATEEDLKLRLFGFLSDSRITVNSLMKNSLNTKPEIHSLDINADLIDNDKLLQSMSKVHKAMNTNNNIKNFDLGGLTINNGKLNIKRLIIKSLNASNITGDFSIDESGIFYAQNIKVDVEEGKLKGKTAFSLITGDADLNLELNNVDANYVAETLFEAKNQIYGRANGKIIMHTTGFTDIERIKNLSGFLMFEINDGRMPRLGSLEYLLHASNILKSGITGFTINSILELLNLVKSGYFSNIYGTCTIEDGKTEDLEIFSTGDNLSMYIHGTYDLAEAQADMEILGKLSQKISTVFGVLGNTSINTFFKMIPGISLLDFGRKDFIEDVEKIPSFTNGEYDARVFQAIIEGNVNETSSVKSFKWVKQ